MDNGRYFFFLLFSDQITIITKSRKRRQIRLQTTIPVGNGKLLAPFVKEEFAEVSSPVLEEADTVVAPDVVSKESPDAALAIALELITAVPSSFVS